MENKTEETIGVRQENDKRLVIEKLKEMPIIQVACQKVGIGRATYYRWKKEDPLFRKACDEAIVEGIFLINDMSESQLISLIREKKLTAIALWLKNNHTRYGAKGEIEHGQNLPVALSVEQEETVKKALRIVRPQKFYGKIKQKRNRGKNH